jgi:hypothetical protein
VGRACSDRSCLHRQIWDGRTSRDSESLTPKTLVIPASTTALTPEFFLNERSVEAIEFEAGSQIRRLEACTFAYCTALKSICIPASVESLAQDCFVAAPPLFQRHGGCGIERITFERWSKLREIEPGAFYRCVRSQHILIPASVEKMTGSSFPSGVHIQIEVERGNQCFVRNGDLLIDSRQHHLVRYWRRETGATVTVKIPDEIETLDSDCCSMGHNIQLVSFLGTPKLSSIGTEAFYGC